MDVLVPVAARREHWIYGVEEIGGCETPNVGAGIQPPRALQEQQMLLTVELSFQPLSLASSLDLLVFSFPYWLLFG